MKKAKEKEKEICIMIYSVGSELFERFLHYQDMPICPVCTSKVSKVDCIRCNECKLIVCCECTFPINADVCHLCQHVQIMRFYYQSESDIRNLLNNCGNELPDKDKDKENKKAKAKAKVKAQAKPKAKEKEKEKEKQKERQKDKEKEMEKGKEKKEEGTGSTFNGGEFAKHCQEYQGEISEVWTSMKKTKAGWVEGLEVLSEHIGAAPTEVLRQKIAATQMKKTKTKAKKNEEGLDRGTGSPEDRKWRKQLREMFMEYACILLRILKPTDEWDVEGHASGDMAGIQKALCEKCVDFCESLLEDMRLAEEDDYPEDAAKRAAMIQENLAFFKGFCKYLGMPKAERRRSTVRLD